MNNPKVSVVMSVYNGEKYLKEAIDSILSQTFSDFEFIIINDGSTDNSKNILESYSDERIRLFNNTNKGLTRSLNEAIGYSKGMYIARMDCDDISLPLRFQKQVEALDDDPGLAICGTCAVFIDENGNYLKDFNRPITHQEIKKELLFHNPFIHPSVMVRKNTFEKVGLYDMTFRYAQDYELWTRVVLRLRCINLPDLLFQYRLNVAQMTNKSSIGMKKEAVIIRMLCIYRFLFRF